MRFCQCGLIVFVTLPGDVRYALVGDLVRQCEGLSIRRERPALVRRYADWDTKANRRNILWMASSLERLPDLLVIVPAHDQWAIAELSPPRRGVRGRSTGLSRCRTASRSTLEAERPPAVG